MSDQTTDSQSEPTPPEGEKPAEVFDADYVAKLRKEAAKYRTEAKENSEAARRLSEFEQAQKSDADRAAERLAEFERRATQAESQLLRHEIARTKGIPEWADLLSGTTEAEIEATADLVIARINAVTQPRQPRPDPNQGRLGQTQALNGDGLEMALRDKLGIG